MYRKKLYATALLIAITTSIFFGFPHDLQCEMKEGPVRFAIIGDRTGSHVPGIYPAIIGEIELMKPDFVMTVGDMIEGYSNDYDRVEAEWDEYMTFLEPLTCPIYHTPGNHDIWDEKSLEIYKKRIGDNYYSFDYKGLHFTIFDASIINTSDELPREQVKWLEKDLKKSRNASHRFVFYHKPLWLKPLELGEKDKLHEIFKKYSVDAVFTGHYHNYFSGEYDGIKYTSIGSSGGGSKPMPHGLHYHFAWVTVDDRGVSIAVIKKDSVLPWDNFPASQFVLLDSLQRTGLSLEDRIFVSEGNAIENVKCRVKVHNPAACNAFSDTLRWKVERNWQIEPVWQVVEISPGSDQVLEFNFTNLGDIYPAPIANLDFTFAEDRTFTVGRPLQLTREVSCIKAENAPVIDGQIDDACWQQSVSKFYNSDGSAMMTDPVYFYFTYDDENLYLAALCEDSEIASLVAAAKERDGAVYSEDCVGYFFQPDVEKNEVFQVYFNPLGTVYDVKFFTNEKEQWDMDRDWNGEYEIKTLKEDDYWSIEAKIPLEQLNAKIGENETWGINFRRKQPRLKTAADWQLPISFDPNTLGVMKME